MELFTRNFDPSWDKILHLSVEKTNGISNFINDDTTFKIVLVDSGSLTVKNGEAETVLHAPSVIGLTSRDFLEYKGDDKLKTTTLFFKPSVIREEFENDRVLAGEFEERHGETIYSDYMLIDAFYKIQNPLERALRLGPVSYRQASKLIQQTDFELRVQHDGFWPCRSRSLFMELLYHLVYLCPDADLMPEANGTEFSGTNNISEIISFLNEHIDENITIKDIEKKFGMNRNRINEIFIEETSLTCMNYFINMRLQLAKIILAETEVPIGEISARVGYPDMNYFTRLFKKRVGVTPSLFRNNAIAERSSC